jgi:pimeloyl-ACP methyl ester carboxylesterase
MPDPAPQLISEGDLVALRARLRAVRRAPAIGTGWGLGLPDTELTRILAQWASFDPAPVQARIDSLEHRFVEIDGQPVHVTRAAGTGPDPLPLLLTNGWPSSFLEYLDLIPLLTGPDDAGPGFSVVIPALPGYGFSAAPSAGALGARQTADLWNTLMTAELGHDRYVAHGSDLGGGITGWLARDHADSVAAIHLASPHLALATGPRDGAQERFAKQIRAWSSAEGAYAHMHSTKPVTAGAGLSDSPAGLAAWIAEKWFAWSSGAPPTELLLATLTLYWATNTITTSLLPYWAFSRGDNALPIDNPSPVPTAVSVFAGEQSPFPVPPRSLGERYFTIRRWQEHPTGGHFPAACAPTLLASELRAAFADL